MFHQTLYIHLCRPFLKSSAATNSTLAHLDPRKACIGAASTMSKYLRFYKRRYGLRQICNIAGYFIHSACTIHLLNLQQPLAGRDIIQGLKGLEEMGECWLVAKRSLVIIGVFVKRRGIQLPEEAEGVLKRCWKEAARFGLGAQVEKILKMKTVPKGPAPLPKPPRPPASASATPNQTAARSPPLPSLPPPTSPTCQQQHHQHQFQAQQPSTPHQQFPTQFYSYFTPQGPQPTTPQILSTATTGPLSPGSCGSGGTPASEVPADFEIDQGFLECDNWWWRDTTEFGGEMIVDGSMTPGANWLGPAGGGAGGIDGQAGVAWNSGTTEA